MRVAVCQMPGATTQFWQDSLALIESLADAAARRQADLAVFPECAWPAYHLGSRASYDAARRGGLPGPAHLLDVAAGLARRLRLMICVGFVEERDNRLLNSAALVGADGALLGVRSKSFLWDFDHDWFTAGDRIEPIDTPLGRVGIMICADARLPEIPATLAARGAQLIVQPTAWVNGGAPGQLWNPQADFLIRARAEEFGVPIASASKWSQEGGTTFVGSSLVCSAAGDILTQLGTSETAIGIAEIEPASRASEIRRPTLPLERRVLLNGPPLDTAEVSELRREWARGAEAAAARTPGVPPAAASSNVQRLAAAEAGRFAPCRAATLLGVRCFDVIGAGVSEPLIRARAAENRVFITWYRGEDVRICDVRGRRLPPQPGAADGIECFRFDDREALDKRVADRTDIIADRTPAMYEF
ncbi:(R)-stereoselective amidase [Phycisphaerae bacterium RAS1]|nr:(R)-stereoselective amidase [Phycisphaerae bacterium RAS1]